MEHFVDINEIKKSMIDKNIRGTCELSDKTGISRNTLSNIFNGNSKPSMDVMYKLADFFGWSPEKCGSIFFATKLTQDVSYYK